MNATDATNIWVKNQASSLNGLSASANETWGVDEPSITPSVEVLPRHIVGGLMLSPFQEPEPTVQTDVTPSFLKSSAAFCSSFSRFSLSASCSRNHMPILLSNSCRR